MGATVMYMNSSVPPAGGPRGVLTSDDLAAIGALPDVGHVMPVIGDALTVRHASASREIYVFSVNARMPAVHHWNIAEGR